MFPNGFGMNGYWGPENYVLGAALFDWHKDYDDLPEELEDMLHDYFAKLSNGGSQKQD